ncbi:MAG TPA: chemotaxis protein CheD [Cerasibacillus sp.]|uniref:chemotaxis protein CheD n=1 Tax=Cerasibacillus sp. TaxID=2498711 RepID=UPI002F427B66
MNKHDQIIKVGIADLNIAKAPDKIRTSGLGSCVGVIIYDEKMKLGGLAHIMLPDSQQAKLTNKNNYKYADTAIQILVKKMLRHGARQFALQAKLAGGAQMFKFANGNDMMRIGPRNIAAVKKILAQYRIPIIAADVGGSSGRTIEFDPATNRLKIRTVNKGETFI